MEINGLEIVIYGDKSPSNCLGSHIIRILGIVTDIFTVNSQDALLTSAAIATSKSKGNRSPVCTYSRKRMCHYYLKRNTYSRRVLVVVKGCVSTMRRIEYSSIYLYIHHFSTSILLLTSIRHFSIKVAKTVAAVEPSFQYDSAS